MRTVAVPLTRHARITLAACLAAAASLASPAAHADGNWSIGALGGSLGLGAQVGYRFGDHVGVRVDGASYDYDRTVNVDDIDYDGTLALQSFGAQLDVYPFGGGFRISAGVRSNGNEVRMTATPTTSVSVGNQVFTPAQIGTLTGKAEVKSSMPTLTIGYGGKLAKGFTVGLDLGVGFQGEPKITSLTATGGTLSSTPQVQQQLVTEQARIEEEVKDYGLWPILQLSFVWRF